MHWSVSVHCLLLEIVMFACVARIQKGILLFGIFGFSAVASAQAQFNTPGSSASSPLIVGSEQEYPPFSKGMTDETAGGFTVELWNAVAREEGLNSKIRVLPFEKVLSGFKAKRIDVMINLAQSPERRKFADFSAPHVIVKGAVFVRSNNPNIRQESDIRERKVILLSQDLSHDYALAAYPGKAFVLVETPEEGFTKLLRGEGEAFLLSKVAGMVLLDQMGLKGKIEARTDANFKQEFSFAVHKGNEELRQKINEGLILVSESGEYDRIYNKWFGQYQQKPIDRTWITIFAFVALAITTGLAIFIYVRYLIFKRRQTQQLKQTEAIFRAAFETAVVGMVQASLDGQYLRVNKSYCAFLGYTEEELVRKSFMEITHPEDLGGDLDLFDMLKAGKIDHFRLEKRYIRKDGKITWGRIYVSLIPEVRGSPQTVLTAIEDINQEIADKTELRNKEARYRGLLEMAIDPTVVVSDQGIITDLNLEAANRLNVSPEAMIGKHISQVDEMIASDHLTKAFEDAVSGEFVNREGNQIYWDGQPRRIDVTASRIDLEDSAVVKISIHDSTERYHLIDQTKELAGRLDLALEAGKIGCYTFHAADNEFKIDRRLANIIGFEPEGTTTIFSVKEVLRKVHQEDHQLVIAFIEAARENHSFSAVVRLVDRNRSGSPRAIQIRAESFSSGEDGRTVQLGACYDISEQVNSARELKEINVALNEATGAKDKLIAKLSHELRTPLNVILGFSQILEARLMDAQNRELIKKVFTSGEYLLGLINDMLLLSDTSTQLDTTKEEIIDLAAEASQVCALLQPMAGAMAVRLEIESGNANSGAPLMKGDRRSLRQILLNIVDNAIKYNRQGGSVKIRCEVSPVDEVVVTVTDTGAGMDARDIDRLYVPFYRGWAESSSVQGTGLGLTITRDLTEAMGGRISVESVVGEGATFTLAFPRAYASEPVEVDGDEEFSVSEHRMKLVFVDCLGAAAPKLGTGCQDTDEIVKMRDSVQVATGRMGRFSSVECQLSTDLAAIKQSNADAFLLIVFSTDDLHWLQELRKSAVTRKRPCFVLLPDTLSESMRETIAMSAIACGAECILFWKDIQRLVRDIQLISGEIRP